MNRQAAKDAKEEEPGDRVDELARKVVDAAFEVHQVLGPGFLESVYEQALCTELGLRKVSFERQVSIAVRYKGQVVGESRLDVLVGGSLVVEIKATEQLAPVHVAQVIS